MDREALTRLDLEYLAAKAGQLGELLVSGAIGADEHRALLDLVWNQAAEDRAAARRRREDANRILAEMSAFKSPIP
jgi:hypothetical protein